ncbi:MAG: hypothetical protein AAGK14_00770 [Verrucomicrobiota bacterium]
MIELLFHALAVLGVFTLALMAALLGLFLLWLLYATYLRKPDERPGRKVDYRREDVE